MPGLRRSTVRVLVISSLLTSLGVGFAWGLLAYRNQLFPYHELRGLAIRMGLHLGLSEQPFLEAVSPQTRSPRGVAEDSSALLALPYIAGTRDSNVSVKGVIKYDPTRAWEGVNLYNSDNGSAAYLVSMRGKVLWTWTLRTTHWHLSKLDRDGSLLVVLQDEALVKLDSLSRPVWRFPAKVHHSVWVTSSGMCYVPVREVRADREIHPSIPVVDPVIAVLDSNGNEIDQFSVLDSIQRSAWAGLVPSVYDLDLTDPRTGRRASEIDLFHLNGIVVFDGSQQQLAPFYKKGNILISLRNLNAIAILDGKTHDMIWLWGPTNITRQHDPSVLPDGHVLLFDNGVSSSRVLELDPVSRRIVWRCSPTKDFFSAVRGSAQRLPNGNTLITDSDRGYVFEVTPECKVVWEFANPEIEGMDHVRRAIYRMTRYDRASIPFLK